MGAGEAWGQDQREGSVGAEGTGGAREEQTLVKTNTNHKNKTIDIKNNECIQTLTETNAQMYFKWPKSCMNVITYMQQ